MRPIPHDISSTRFDVIIVGAGINGASIARDASARGLRVLLLDKGDLAGGTTSWSTRLIHGGLRYLEHGELGWCANLCASARRCCASRRTSSNRSVAASHLRGASARPAHYPRGDARVRPASFGKSLPRHRMLTREEACVARYA